MNEDEIKANSIEWMVESMRKVYSERKFHIRVKRGGAWGSECRDRFEFLHEAVAAVKSMPEPERQRAAVFDSGFGIWTFQKNNRGDHRFAAIDSSIDHKPPLDENGLYTREWAVKAFGPKNE